MNSHSGDTADLFGGETFDVPVVHCVRMGVEDVVDAVGDSQAAAHFIAEICTPLVIAVALHLIMR